MKNIITEIEAHPRTTALELDETYDAIDHIPKLKTTLYPHQKTAIRAMLDVENKRIITVKIPSREVPDFIKKNKGVKKYIDGILQTGISLENLKQTYRGYNIDAGQFQLYLKAAALIDEKKAAAIEEYRITYNTAVFTDPVGVGKTITILGLILLSAKPRALPEIIRVDYTNLQFARGKFKRLLQPTLCVVNKSVLAQWEVAIKRFTDLRYFIVKSVVELKKLFSAISSGEIAEYDIIVVKNGQITVPFEMPSNITCVNPSNNRSHSDIYNLLANLYECCWARVVIDDYDTVGLPRDTSNINALFTWLISSSRYKGNYTRTDPHPLDSVLLFRKIIDYDINTNNYLFTYLNVRNNKKYIEANLAMPKVKYHMICFKNESNKIISILKSVGDEDLSRVSEMLNSNAINTAARLVGIESNSVQDIFKTVLGNKWTGYQSSIGLINFIDFQSSDDKKSARRGMGANPDPSDTYGKHDLVAQRDIEYKYPSVDTLLINNRDEQSKIKTKLSTEIDRIKSSLVDGECPICICELKAAEEIIISKCCFVVMCSECAIKTNGFNDKFNRLQNGTCPNCRATTTIKNMIFFKTSLVKIDSIVHELFSEQAAIEPCAPDAVAEKKDVPVRKTHVANKNEALLEIILRGAVPGDVRIDMSIANMMPGHRSCVEPAYRKVLIFSNYDETLHSIEADLKKNNIRYWHLRGSNYEITRIAAEFTDCTRETCVMVINSTKYCSGLNLQTATDLVFTHFIYDINIETQVGGRGQRIGRDSQLNIWYLVNDNEKHLLARRYNVRQLSDEELLEEASGNNAGGDENKIDQAAKADAKADAKPVLKKAKPMLKPVLKPTFRKTKPADEDSNSE